MKPDLQAIRNRAERFDVRPILEIDKRVLINHVVKKDIPALLAYISELEAAKQWVPVSERLPEAGTKVWARLKFFASETVRHYELVRVDEDDCTWRTVDDNSEIAHEWNVTHWMLIPQLPEDNNYRIRCKGKGKACDKFPGQPDRPEKKEAGAGE